MAHEPRCSSRLRATGVPGTRLWQTRLLGAAWRLWQCPTWHAGEQPACALSQHPHAHLDLFRGAASATVLLLLVLLLLPSLSHVACADQPA